VFYLKYHYYCLYFPLMALAKYQQASGGPEQQQWHSPHLGLTSAAREMEIHAQGEY
jgi:hypothetical protein